MMAIAISAMMLINTPQITKAYTDCSGQLTQAGLKADLYYSHG